MAQGKSKAKKLPADIKNKNKNKTKGKAITKRNNAPVKPKTGPKKDKLKAVVSKMVNKRAEKEIRSLAVESGKPLSKAQEAQVKHSQRNKPGPS